MEGEGRRGVSDGVQAQTETEEHGTSPEAELHLRNQFNYNDRATQARLHLSIVHRRSWLLANESTSDGTNRTVQPDRIMQGFLH